ncbi:MAG: transposase [Acidobacteriota bacterium]
MRHVRLTWPGAYHHVMNRGHNNEMIFNSDELKKEYISILGNEAVKKRMRIFGFCLMDNHFHIILENTSGRMSDFMKMINGCFGKFYRGKRGGRGYVFHDRFKSTVIQDDSYLMTVISYFLNNPVRAGIVKSPFDYKWSSASMYFNKTANSFVDLKYVEELYVNREVFIKALNNNISKESCREKRTKFGNIFGDKEFIKRSEKLFDRRNEFSKYLNKREEDFYFEPVEKIIQEFVKKFNVSINEIDTSSFQGKRMRGELLRRLKDLGGLKYSEIYEFDIFKDLRFNSLGRLYKRADIRFNNKK